MYKQVALISENRHHTFKKEPGGEYVRVQMVKQEGGNDKIILQSQNKVNYTNLKQITYSRDYIVNCIQPHLVLKYTQGKFVTYKD